MKKVYLIGIGPGNPKYLTLEACDLIKRLRFFIIPDKKGKKTHLTLLRERILNYLRPKKDYRLIRLDFGERSRKLPYVDSVKEWRKLKAELLFHTLQGVEEVGILVLGDPSFYDGYIEVLKYLSTLTPVHFEVVPGISSMQLLSAKHKIPLSDIGGSVVLTTPRGLKKMPKIENNTVVFLDNYETFRMINDPKIWIYWGAYLGTEKETVLSGRLFEIKDQLIELRHSLRKEHGYIMEIYLLSPKET